MEQLELNFGQPIQLELRFDSNDLMERARAALKVFEGVAPTHQGSLKKYPWDQRGWQPN